MRLIFGKGDDFLSNQPGYLGSTQETFDLAKKWGTEKEK